MSKVYKRVTLLVSRSYGPDGNASKDQGLRFFRSQEEYDQEAEKHDWNKGKPPTSSWCSKPIEMEALVSQDDLARFEHGHPLAMDTVFFASTVLDAALQHDGWYG